MILDNLIVIFGFIFLVIIIFKSAKYCKPKRNYLGFDYAVRILKGTEHTIGVECDKCGVHASAVYKFDKIEMDDDE